MNVESEWPIDQGDIERQLNNAVQLVKELLLDNADLQAMCVKLVKTRWPIEPIGMARDEQRCSNLNAVFTAILTRVISDSLPI